jgi:hypothetical protein
MEDLIQKSKEFVERLLSMGLPEVTKDEMLKALWMSPEGLTAVLTLISSNLIREVQNGDGIGFTQQHQLFNLGVTLGVAYGIKVSVPYKDISRKKR